jgi:hypothetical protein
MANTTPKNILLESGNGTEIEYNYKESPRSPITLRSRDRAVRIDHADIEWIRDALDYIKYQTKDNNHNVNA